MRKLVLKHLTPYLPYDLFFNRLEHKCIDHTTNPVIYSIEKYPIRTHLNFVTLNGFNYEENKPLLRRKTYLHSLQSEILMKWGGGLSDKMKDQWLKEVTDDMLYSFNSLRYDFVEFMLENHIDVFNLIDDDLATEIKIDIKN